MAFDKNGIKQITLIIDDFSIYSYLNPYYQNVHDYVNYSLTTYLDYYFYDLLYGGYIDKGDVDNQATVIISSYYDVF